MEDKNILIVLKTTKVEWDMQKLNLSEEQLKKFYEKEKVDSNKIFYSHKKQKEGLENIKKLLTNSRLIHRNELNKDIVKNYDLVISFGGDNHFQLVSHFLDDVPILGINSDPERSEGALTNINSTELEEFIKNILNNEFQIEKWTRLEVKIDEKEIEELAISEIFIGEERRFDMSRHVLRLNGESEEQKGSGLLITTGSGSTGWYNSASRYLFSNGDRFSKTLNEARFILTEPYNGRLSKYKLINGKIKEKEFLEIISLSNYSPFLSIDSLRLIKLREWAKIRVKIGKPLKTMKLK